VSAALSRAAGHGRAAPPVRLVHLGLGNFFRAHQCWYTEHAPDADGWGYAAFSGLGASDVAERLTAQDGLYTLVTRAASGDTYEVISSLSKAHAAQDHRAWLDYFRSPQLSAVTLTVTEAGYLRGPDGGLDADRAEVQADLAALRDDRTAPVRTAPARIVAGMAARRAAGAGAVALVPQRARHRGDRRSCRGGHGPPPRPRTARLAGPIACGGDDRGGPDHPAARPGRGPARP
jgi:fructuronate reductase